METILPLLTALKKLDLQQRGPYSRFGDREALILAQKNWAEAGWPMPTQEEHPLYQMAEDGTVSLLQCLRCKDSALMAPTEEKSFGEATTALLEKWTQQEAQNQRSEHHRDLQQEMHRLTGRLPRSSGPKK